MRRIFHDPLFTNKLEIINERVANNPVHILSIVIFIVVVVVVEGWGGGGVVSVTKVRNAFERLARKKTNVGEPRALVLCLKYHFWIHERLVRNAVMISND